MLKPKTRSKPSAKRDAILDAAQGLFLSVGYAATSMDSVASGAGVSKATIYAHFDSKEELFSAMMQRRCDASFAFTAPEAGKDATQTLTAIGERLLALLIAPESLALFRVVVAESARVPELAKAFYETGPAKGKAAIAAAIAELQERGELSRDQDAAVITDQLAGMIRTETYQRALLGLPSGRTPVNTVASTVDTLIRAYGKR